MTALTNTRGGQRLNCSHTQKDHRCPRDPQIKEGAKARLLAHRRTIGVPRDPQIPHTEADIATCESLTHYQGGASPGNDHLANRYASVEHSHIDLGGVYVVGLMR